MEIKNIAIVGFGAIGAVFGKAIYKAYDEGFAVVADGSRKERLETNGVIVNDEKIFPRVVNNNISDFKADLIIFSVKNYQLEEALNDVKGLVDEHTVLLTILNGVSARDRILDSYPNNTVLYGIAFIDAARYDKGVKSVNGGKIVFGNNDNKNISDEVSAVKKVFKKSGINHEVPEDMQRMVWKKWMINVGGNQVSAITGATYGAMLEDESTHKILREAMQEVVNIAKANNIDLSEEDIDAYDKLLPSFAHEGRSSMLQDVDAKRKTEVEYFSGTVMKWGKKSGVPTPVNDTFYYLIKSIEHMY